MNDLSDGHRVLLKRIRNESLAKFFSLSSLLFFFSGEKKKRKKKAQKVNVWTPLSIRPTICPLDGMDTYRVCEDFDALGCWLTARTRQSPRRETDLYYRRFFLFTFFFF